MIARDVQRRIQRARCLSGLVISSWLGGSLALAFLLNEAGFFSIVMERFVWHLLLMLVVVVWVGAFIWVFFRINIWSARRFGLVCPHCGTPAYLSQVYGPVDEQQERTWRYLVETGRCNRCDQTVFPLEVAE